MLHDVSILAIGYSILSTTVLMVVLLNRRREVSGDVVPVSGLVLLVLLAVMQFIHYRYLQYGEPLVHEGFYRMLLFAAAPLFYLFAQPFLTPDFCLKPAQFLHVLPVIVAVILPYDVALPLAFVIGVAYLLVLARLVYRLRVERKNFKLEMTLLAVLFGLGIVVALASLNVSLWGERLFYEFYSIAIGVLFIVVSVAMSSARNLSAEVAEVVRESYAVTTLANVDCDAVFRRLESLMDQDCLYKELDLSLQRLAEQLDLGAHQLSELINTRMGKTFPRYLREQRVAAAERMLVAEPSASVLSVGLAVGFSSQSSYYEAFREITGMTPGKYRQIHLLNIPE